DWSVTGVQTCALPILRKRLNVAGDESSLRYDNNLVEAVKAFQKSKGGAADGVLGPGTVRQLNSIVPPRRSDAVETVIINMERWQIGRASCRERGGMEG